MKPKKDISDLIRDNQHKLEERPSPRAWNKLEGKLDNHQFKSRTFLYRKLAMAAAVVALVAVISLLAVLTNQKQDNFANAKIGEENWMVQDLETISTDGNKNLREAIEFQRKLKNRYPNTISEGNATKRLLASNNNIPDGINQSPNSSKPSIAMNVPPSKSIKNEAPDLSYSAEKEVESFSNSGESQIIESEEIAEVEIAADMASSSTKLENNKLPVDGNIAIRSRAKASKKMKELKSEFDWLVGKWTSSNSEITWRKEKNFDFVSEKFTLKTTGDKLVFIKNNEIENPYFLVESDSGSKKLVFRNKNKDSVKMTWKNNSKFTLVFYNNSTYELVKKEYEKN